MRLTDKLLGYLNRVFSRDPQKFLALRFAHNGTAMTWSVQDGILTTAITGGSGSALTVDLSAYTIGSLANHIGAQTGYTILYVNTEKANISAQALLDGSGNPANSNGDHLYAYSSLLFAWTEATAIELVAAKGQIANALLQMDTNTAEGYWLDEIGAYYGIRRIAGEVDGLYGPRIIEEVIRPRSNNKALEMAISITTGGEVSRVIDVQIYDATAPVYNGTYDHDGSEVHDGTRAVRYNLFDVQYSFDLEGADDITAFTARVISTIEKFRAAGTHLRDIELQASHLSDSVAAATDTLAGFDVEATLSDTNDDQTEGLASALALAAISEDAAEVTEAAEIDVAYTTLYDGARLYNGMVPHASGGSITESI